MLAVSHLFGKPLLLLQHIVKLADHPYLQLLAEVVSHVLVHTPRVLQAEAESCLSVVQLLLYGARRMVILLCIEGEDEFVQQASLHHLLLIFCCCRLIRLLHGVIEVEAASAGIVGAIYLSLSWLDKRLVDVAKTLEVRLLAQQIGQGDGCQVSSR